MMAKRRAGCGHKSCFSDLNVILSESKGSNKELIQRMISYGYKRIGLNTEFVLAKKGEKVKESVCLPDEVVSITTEHRDDIEVLQRLTVIVEDHSLLHVLAASPVNSYDLLAIRPLSERVFQQACSSLSVDVISLDLTKRLPFYLKLAQINQAIERGVQFEICYSHAIKDVTCRRNILSNAQDLVKASKGKNIIVSSEADSAMELRAPYDVINLCTLFGLRIDQSKAALTTSCRATVISSNTRRQTAKGVISHVSKDCITSFNKWMMCSPLEEESIDESRKTDNKRRKTLQH